MNNKTLLYIFGALLVLFLASKLFNKKSDRSFEVEVVSIDTSMVDQIKLYPKANEGQEILFEKQGGNWKATQNGLTVDVTRQGIQGLLANMSNIPVDRAVTKTPEKWIDYEVDEANGSRVVAMQGSKTLGDFIVGRFNFDQMTRSATSYIRRNGEDVVYAVDGFLGMSFNRGFDSFRDKSLVKTAKEDINQINISSPDYGNHTIIKNGNTWLMDNATLLDSAKMVTWINGLTFASGSEFLDGYSPGAPLHSMQILANNQATPVTITAYPNTNEEKPFVLHSTENNVAYFASDSTGVYSKFFKPVEELIGE